MVRFDMIEKVARAAKELGGIDARGRVVTVVSYGERRGAEKGGRLGKAEKLRGKIVGLE